MNQNSNLPLSDEEFLALIQKCQAGDSAASEEFFERYNPHLKRCVRRHLLNPALRMFYDSNDIMNSALRRFWERKTDTSFASFREFQAYMSQIVQNRIRQAHNRLQQELTARRKGSLENTSPEITDSELAQELIFRVKEILSEEEWALFEAVKLKNISFVELSKKTDVGSDAIRKRFNRIFEKVKTHIGLDDLLQ